MRSSNHSFSSSRHSRQLRLHLNVGCSTSFAKRSSSSRSRAWAPSPSPAAWGPACSLSRVTCSAWAPRTFRRRREAARPSALSATMAPRQPACKPLAACRRLLLLHGRICKGRPCRRHRGSRAPSTPSALLEVQRRRRLPHSRCSRRTPKEEWHSPLLSTPLQSVASGKRRRRSSSSRCPRLELPGWRRAVCSTAWGRCSSSNSSSCRCSRCSKCSHSSKSRQRRCSTPSRRRAANRWPCMRDKA
mmetsp:Transcript_25303/g.72847  ORF Transcript_25303/g.72847 Transcript_25303/m.72847 type:complete len:245 (+) Transcript_25303:964-1698(+)